MITLSKEALDNIFINFKKHLNKFITTKENMIKGNIFIDFISKEPLTIHAYFKQGNFIHDFGEFIIHDGCNFSLTEIFIQVTGIKQINIKKRSK